MKSALLGTSAAVALVLGFGLTASAAAQQAAGPGPAPVEQPAGAAAGRPGQHHPGRQPAAVGAGSTRAAAPARRRDGDRAPPAHGAGASRRPARSRKRSWRSGRVPRLAGRRRGAAVGDRPGDQRAPDLQGAPDQHGRPQGAALRRDELEVAAGRSPTARPAPNLSQPVGAVGGTNDPDQSPRYACSAASCSAALSSAAVPSKSSAQSCRTIAAPIYCRPRCRLRCAHTGHGLPRCT